MEAFLVSTLLVAVGEIGDKTQLLALILSTRFRRPAPIVLGILAATLANHALAGALGEWVRSSLDPSALRWLIGGSFIGLAAWTLKPDKMEGTRCTVNRCGVFFVTLSAFFLAEMGDKTQLATIALAAELHAFVPVVAGTTFGMLVANVPIVLAGDKLAARVPLKAVRKVAAALFIVFGIVVLLA